MVKLTNEEQSLLNEEPSNILNSLDILIALRKASQGDDTDTFSRAASTSSKSRKPKTSTKIDVMDSAAESPGPSPGFANARLKGNPGRSASVASARDGKEIKVEEGMEGAKGPSAEKAGKFQVGAEVAYKQARPKEDGSQWIICNVKSIQTVGSKKRFVFVRLRDDRLVVVMGLTRSWHGADDDFCRYEVQDPEPDDMGGPGDVYMASANALIPIPSADADLPDYPVGKAVLARYPETTTFYRAEVIANLRKGVCKLRFEDDQNQEMEVARRFVLNLEK